jgi:hypothetical protein
MNKKDIIIIGAYPNRSHKLEMLRECIEKVKPLGYDIMVVSHYPIPEDIQREVDYVIYDKENLLIYNSCPEFFFNVEGISLKRYNLEGGYHSLSCVKNINNGINFANYLKYRFFFYMECDNLFDPNDLLKIEILKNSMMLENKQMILFHHSNPSNVIYETLIFGGVPSYYCQEIHLPKEENDLNGSKISLERFFYDTHNAKESSYYVVNSSTEQYFSNSEINKEFEKFIVGIFGSNKEPNLYLFIRNLSENPNSFFVTINDGPIEEFCSGYWSLTPVHLGSPLKVSIDVDGVETVKEYGLTENDKLKYFSDGWIHFS